MTNPNRPKGYGYDLSYDEAHDLVLIRLDQIAATVSDAELAYMAQVTFDDPETEHWLRTCEDDEIAEWVDDVRLDSHLPTL